MRSKEVEEAIKRTDQLYNGISIGLIINVKSDGTTCKSLGTVLSYIKTLEQLPNKIRDKIKLYELEIETLKTLYPKSYEKDDEYKMYVIKIQELKSIIGE